jgi:homoserine O-acetyltransferase
MGGMTTLEWSLNTPPGFVRNILPLATSARHSAWCISWGEAQRQAIYSDPMYADGWYEPDEEGQPKVGLAAARMTALLTYRSRDSFETRFGRKTQGALMRGGTGATSSSASEGEGEGSAREEAWRLHNDGHRKAKVYRSKPATPAANGSAAVGEREGGILAGSGPGRPKSPPTVFSAQSYLRYQGDKVRSAPAPADMPGQQ